MAGKKAGKGPARSEAENGGDLEGGLPASFVAALEAARGAPGDMGAWDRLEDEAAEAQKPDEVVAAYEEVLRRDLPAHQASTIGERAAGFIEEWLGEAVPELHRVLGRVLAIDPNNEWAFQRLSVVFTVAGRWDELLELYDQAIEAARDVDRRLALLDEAANVAKDLAGFPDRAIPYMQRLLEVRKDDAQLEASLERLLERLERWEDLIELWGRGMSDMPRAEAHGVRLRIAQCYLDKLHDPNGALAHIYAIIREDGEGEDALRMLEAISEDGSAPPEARRKALYLLRSQYEAKNRAEDVARTLGTAIALAEGKEAVALRREAGQRLMADEMYDEAMGHYAALLELEPSAVDARQRLQQLASRIDAHGRMVEAFRRAADRCEAPALRVSLRLEAADVLRSVVEDPAGAIDLYLSVLADAEAEESSVLRACRRLQGLLEGAGRSEELLEVLERLGSIEPEPRERRGVLGRAARLADGLARPDRALALWEKRLEEDRGDREALDATVDVLEREGRWAALVDALRRRMEAARSEAERRADLVRIARTQSERLEDLGAGVETWREVERTFGQDAETVDALSDLLARAERPDELHEVLEGAASREALHVAEVLVRLGRTYQQDPEKVGAAADCFERALRVVPGDRNAIEALRSQLEDEDGRPSAVPVLLDAFRRTGSWPEVVSLLEHRLEVATEEDERARILWESARIQASRLEDREGALGSMGRAIVRAPDWHFLERELLELAGATERWATAAESLRRAAEATEDAARRLHLRVLRARVLEEHVKEAGASSEAWAAALELRPDRVDLVEAVVRTAGSARLWERVAEAAIAHVAAVAKVAPDLVDSIEGLGEATSDWEGLARAFDATLARSEELEAPLGRELDRIVARWLEDECADAAAAEAALSRAVGRGDPDEETLRHLVRLSQGTPGREQYDTLMRLADWAVGDDDLDPLEEAARIAAEQLGDPELERAALERLYREASRLWRRGAEASGLEQPEDSVFGSLEQLLKLYAAAGEHDSALELLLDATRLPVDKERASDLRRRAARLADGPLADLPRTVMLYRLVLEDAPNDAEAIAVLSRIFEQQGRLEELLPLRHQELGLSEDPERRLELRLDIARIVRALEMGGGRLAALKANLDERPGHRASVDAVVEMLAQEERWGELVELLSEQAVRLEEREDGPRAAELWAVVASMAEERLSDLDKAIHAHRRVLELSGSTASLAALARLHGSRAEHSAAARWLERLLKATAGAERAEISLQLARARLASGQQRSAIDCLEAALVEAPGALELRSLLAEQYRETGELEPLARVLTDSAPYLEDPEALRDSALEAASIFEQLSQGDRSIQVLERASAALPEDRDVKRMLASALIAANRVDEARAMLEQLIEQFGRRRSPERAAAHLQLARVLRAEGDLEGALRELDQASGMDVRNTQVMAMLGEMAREAGQLERAERAFRALLMVLRRQPSEDEGATGPSVVLYELGRLTRERGDRDQADELLVSALEAASQSGTESRRFKRAMLARGESELAWKALEKRAELLGEGPELAAALADMADVLEADPERGELALEMRLRAIENAPAAWAVHDRARALARRIGKVELYLDALQARVARARRQEESELAAELLLRLGLVCEEDLEDLEKASEAYCRAEEVASNPIPARLAMARVAAARGDAGEERRFLAALVEDEGVAPDLRIDGRYRLAELLLRSPEGAAEGRAVLETALAEDPQYDRAGALLRAGTTVSPDDGALLALYGRVARAAEEPPLVLDYLEKRAPRDDATLEEVSEAVRLAERLEAEDRVEPLLERAAAVAEASPAGLAPALWALEALAARRKAAADLAGALRFTRAAAGAAPESDSQRLWLASAALAAEAGDREAAAEAYEGLLEKDPTDRKVFEPLIELLCEIGDEDRVSSVVRSTVEQLTSREERNEVRLRLAKFLAGRQGREPDATDVLRAILEEDPDHEAAGALLGDLFERIGYDEELASLLGRQLDGAFEQQNEQTVHDVGLRLGAQLEKVSREQAMEVYRRCLGLLPNDRDLAGRLLGLLGPDDDPRERVELMERPLVQEEGEVAARLAVRLADEWAALDDYDGVRRVLRIGYQLCPSDEAVRTRLEQGYREHEEWEPLAAFLEAEAERGTDAAASVALLRSAAAIHLDRRSDLISSISALVAARRRAPRDVALLDELVRLRADAREHGKAVEEVSEALDELGDGAVERPDLLAMRADLRVALGEEAAAVEDLEAAYSIAGEPLAPRLAVGLDRLRAGAASRGDAEAERAATLRLVDVLRDAGDPARSRQVLREWLERAPEDTDGLYLMLGLDEADGDWQSVAATCAKLVTAETGGAQVEAALRLADSWERLGQPEEARSGLEQVFEAQPEAGPVRERLARLYEQIGASFELATMVVAEAHATEEPDQRFALLRRAGDLYLQTHGGTEAALVPLEEAMRLMPDDHDTTVLLVDAYIASGHHAEAVGVLEQAIGARGNRRTPQLAELQHRMARLAEAAGDREVQLQWLNVALESDRRNGFVAADLAYLAMELGDYETAMKALRVVTVGRSESPMSRAEAFLLQGKIAHARGETGPALAWARRAAAEDPGYAEAEEFLKQLEQN